jgi:putative DNA primase/helicase
MTFTKKGVYPSIPQACMAVGVEFREVDRDGRFHATALTDGSKTSGRIMHFIDGSGGTLVVNWKTQESALYFPQARTKLTTEESIAQQLKQQKIEKKLEANARRRFRAAQSKAIELLNKAKDATAENPYLKRKRVAPKGELKALPLFEIESILKCRLYDREQNHFSEGEILIVPRRINGEITILEFIGGNGSKTQSRNGRLTGAYWISNSHINKYGLNEKIGICEGIATALSIAEKTDITAVSVGSCTNFDACTKEIKSAYPEAEIVILADAGNGEDAAKKCAEKYSLAYRAPSFTSAQIEAFKNAYGADKQPTDFNDLMLIDVIEAQP